MGKRPHIRTGTGNFKAMIADGVYYVDKTDLVREIIFGNSYVTLFTRPRRFGKTLALSMLAEFFDITKKEENAHLFDGLKITEYPEICREYQNAYPVISLSFKEVYGDSAEEALKALQNLIAELYQAAAPALLPNLKDKDQRDHFALIKSGKCNPDDLTDSLRFLTRLLYHHYNLPVIVLLDEYDVPLQKAFVRGYYNKIITPIQKTASAVFKDNDFLKLGVITGCLRIAKESIFTGMNNFSPNSILTKGTPEYFGFTQEETEKLLVDCGLADRIATVQEWYDGYKFGDNEVYNPWSVLKFAAQGMKTAEDAAQPYWMNTSGNDIFSHLIKFYDQNGKTRNEIKALIAGESITKKIDEGTTFGDLDADPESIWSILLFTGYLKTASPLKRINNERCCDLVLPNNEIRDILASELSSWFSRKIRVTQIPGLAEKFLTGKGSEAAREITRFMQLAISLQDSKEAFYHGMLTALMAPLNEEYELSDNAELGGGYPDITLEDTARSIRAVIEIKRAVPPTSSADSTPEKWEESMNQSFETALSKAENQIQNRRYAPSPPDSPFETNFAYAAAFCNKECRIRKIAIF